MYYCIILAEANVLPEHVFYALFGILQLKGALSCRYFPDAVYVVFAVKQCAGLPWTLLICIREVKTSLFCGIGSG